MQTGTIFANCAWHVFFDAKREENLDITRSLIDIIRDASQAAARNWGIEASPEVVLEPPKDREIADLSTNIAMQMCRAKEGIRPLEVASHITDTIKAGIEKKGLGIFIQRVEAVPPGFINFCFSNYYLQSVIADIRKSKIGFGRSKIGSGKKVLIEFVSANPTGPLSVAHGRQAAVGDVLANILEFAGYEVKREYYLNDEGNQITLLGESIYARYCELLGEEQPFPKDGYRGKYIYDIAKSMAERYRKSLIVPDEEASRRICNFGIMYIMATIRKDLVDFGVRFDNYFSQYELSKSGKIEKALAKLKQKGLIYEEGNALWFRSTQFGDDKDRVLRKSDGAYTYITPDIAYHEDKFRRGFDWLIDLWGPDHHGYIPRMKAANRAMGREDETLTLLIIQLATLSRGGVPVAMSTREGEFITLKEVIEEVGKDVARFFFLMRRRDSHLDFDLELAKKESMENPVYYIQYAHARICGVLEYKRKKSLSCRSGKVELLNTEEELAILRLLREFPGVIEWSARNLEPHRLILYLMELATCFHLFYTKHRVVSDDKRLTAARLLLVESLKIVFSRSLSLLGVSCPEKM